MKTTTRMFGARMALALSMTGCNGPHHDGEHAHQYACPHYLEIVQDKPGKCPRCGIKFVEKH